MANEEPGLNGVSGHPLRLLVDWVAEAGGGSGARCFTVTTASAGGAPHARTVLATRIDDDGVRFNTSRPSVKTADLAVNPQVAGVFFWPSLTRQVTLHGRAVLLPGDDARGGYAEQSPNLRALAWVYETLGAAVGAAAGDAADPVEVRTVFDRFLAEDPQQPPPSWTTVALHPDRVDAWWMPGGAGVATRARFTLDADGGWSRRYVLP